MYMSALCTRCPIACYPAGQNKIKSSTTALVLASYVAAAAASSHGLPTGTAGEPAVLQSRSTTAGGLHAAAQSWGSGLLPTGSAWNATNGGGERSS